MTITPEGDRKAKFLVDLGAAASVIPLSAFTRACLNLKLNPSEASLRGASGHSLGVAGEGDLVMRMPGTVKSFDHQMQVVNDGNMPANLRILGVDFWHRMKAKVDLEERTITGVTPKGEQFSLEFSIQGEPKLSQSINAVMAEQSTEQGGEARNEHDMLLTKHIEIQPGQVKAITLELPRAVSAVAYCYLEVPRFPQDCLLFIPPFAPANPPGKARVGTHG